MGDRRRRVQGARERGSVLIEAIVAAGFCAVAAAGVVQVAALVVGMHADAAERSRLIALAEASLLHLRPPGVVLVPGGGLEADVAGFSDEPAPGVRRRWRVTAGPGDGVLTVEVRLTSLALRLGRRTVDLESVVPVPERP